MGGVSARVEPAVNVKVPLALPALFVTVTLMGYDPASGVVPEIVPESASMVIPAGSPVAANLSGAWPVAGIVKRNGLPGREPTTVGCWIRGVAGALSIEIVMSVWAASAGVDRSIAPAATTAIGQQLTAILRADLVFSIGGSFLKIEPGWFGS
jgi:hypothetical protein